MGGGGSKGSIEDNRRGFGCNGRKKNANDRGNEESFYSPSGDKNLHAVASNGGEDRYKGGEVDEVAAGILVENRGNQRPILSG